MPLVSKVASAPTHGAKAAGSAPGQRGGSAPGAAAGVPRRADAFVGASAWASVRLDDALAQTLDAVGSVDGTAAAAAPAQAQGRLYAKTAFLVNVGRTLAWTIYPQAVSPALFASVAADAPSTSGGATFSAYNVFSEADVAPAEESALPLSEQLLDEVAQVLVLDVRREGHLALEDVAADDHLVIVRRVGEGRVAGHLCERGERGGTGARPPKNNGIM
jgi:hypothetical protein